MTMPELDCEALAQIRDPELRASVERLGRTIMQQPQQQEAALKTPAKVIQFPLFPEEARPVSNYMARSALFSCVQGKDRQIVKDALLATVDGVEIRFTGERFNQDDHDVLLQLVFMAKHKPLGDYVEVPARVILKGLGRGTSGKEHEQLRCEIDRLFSAAMKLKNTKTGVTYYGHLIDEALQDEASRYWVYKFNPKLRALYAPSMYTLIEWEQRQDLRGKDLARWLHLYFATHASPFPVKVDTLRELSGSRATLKVFRRSLRLALDDLKNDDIGALEVWEIDGNDLVHVKRGKAITDSQRRYLTGKTIKKRKHKA